MRILIVEDDPLTAHCLEILSKESLGGKIQSIKSLGTLLAAECYLEENPVDLVFLDINLQGKTGFRLLESSVRNSFQTVVVSSERDNAVRAFDYSALDFLPKPITRDRFQTAIDKFLSVPQAAFVPRAIPLKKDEGIDLIEPDKILYARSERNYAQLFTKDGKVERIRKTLDQLHRELESHGFYRPHRSYLVRLNEVKKILFKGPSSYKLLLPGDHSVPVSRSQASKLLSIFKNQDGKVLGPP
ncbi:DNA-binding response regulator [Leptospira perolatii]|uniref:DNA-binding response regulator n=1 Tax=Leptospira perolatii TaxID=2023191 RepID=A0A2M9ZM60_9LEPT|nr:LytTR family DNA-binding domain-containing protein [Leptospira perolatii]PJZ69161.1 DNA-binding response regulator [Leptospira perolatii]PJZ73095.1 DNA-binding response regulator [Leptospira perolatii]